MSEILALTKSYKNIPKAGCAEMSQKVPNPRHSKDVVQLTCAAPFNYCHVVLSNVNTTTPDISNSYKIEVYISSYRLTVEHT